MKTKHLLSASALFLLSGLPGNAATLFVTDNNNINRYDSGTGAPQGTFTGFSRGEGVAFDSQGNLFGFTTNGGGSIEKFAPDGSRSTFATGFDGGGIGFLQSLVVDSADNVYVANHGNTIEKFSPSGVRSVFLTGLGFPTALALDSQDNLYVANNNSASILKFTPAGVQFFFASTSDYIGGLAFDAQDVLHATTGNARTVLRYASDGSSSVLATVSANPHGMAFDEDGNLFIAETQRGAEASGRIEKISPDGTLSLLADNAPSYYIAIHVVPEPSAAAMALTGLAGLLLTRSRKP